ncbi:MAG: DUF2190 family protein [Thermoguttaceae bacterium]|nr:DUF2190 family protein [Thermoguttaceae bacterium]
MALNKEVRWKTGALTAATASDSGVDQYLRVKLDSSTGKLAVAGNDTMGVGVAIRKADPSGNVSYWTFLEAGALCCVAAGSITKFAPVYAAASGKVASSGTVIVGFALEAASASGDIIGVLPFPTGGASTAIPKASKVTALLDNTGGTAADTIPAAAGDAWTKTEIDNAVKSLSTKLNAVITALQGAGLMET